MIRTYKNAGFGSQWHSLPLLADLLSPPAHPNRSYVLRGTMSRGVERKDFLKRIFRESVAAEALRNEALYELNIKSPRLLPHVIFIEVEHNTSTVEALIFTKVMVPQF